MRIEDIVRADKVKRHRALEFLYSDIFPSVKSFILKNNGTAEDALDIFQEGVIVLYDSIKNGKFKNDSTVKTYLFSICKNKWYSKYKEVLKERDILKNGHHNLQNSSYIDDQLLANTMKGLGSDCVKILVGFYYDKMSMKEIMETFNLGSVQAAKNKKMRCLRYLMNLVKKKGFTFANFIVENEN